MRRNNNKKVEYPLVVWPTWYYFSYFSLDINVYYKFNKYSILCSIIYNCSHVGVDHGNKTFDNERENSTGTIGNYQK